MEAPIVADPTAAAAALARSRQMRARKNKGGENFRPERFNAIARVFSFLKIYSKRSKYLLIFE
jgi:hypothetical protein